jgi:hypothetical protein
VDFNGKIKIWGHGQEYSSPDHLPPEIQGPCRKGTPSGHASLNQCLDKIIVDGHETPGGGEPSRRIYDDILSVIENNGQVTLPISSEPLLTSRQFKMVLAVVMAMAALALAVVAKTLS